MATTYVFTEVEVGKNLTLYVDGNSKITVGNGSYEEPVPNALSLPHISTCPGATESCMTACYVYGLQKNAPEVYKKYMQNERVIHRFLMSPVAREIAADAFAAWITENCPDGFRWHVSGDVMNDRYASWIVAVARRSPRIRHWIYTRSLDLVSVLIQAPNLAVNISADTDNYASARVIATETGARVCYLTVDGSIPNDMQEGDVIFPDYSLRGRDMEKPTEHPWWQGLEQKHKKMVCPPDFFGQSERHRCGPCKKCLEPQVDELGTKNRFASGAPGPVTDPSPVMA
jgi:hypothetical protein